MNAANILKASGHRIIAYEVVKNEEGVIREKTLEFLRHDNVSVVITSGGTGISSKDRTGKALHELFSRHVEGFGELFRRLSYDEIGERAILSGAVAGVVEKKLVFCLPGSQQAVEMALKKIILPVLGHMLWEAAR